MALPIPAREAAVGDYSDIYGHIRQVKKNDFLGVVEITFENGNIITPNNETEIMLDQGGRF